nr:MAG TPA: hypothetical protein [Crassvirales sp.]
MYGSTFTVGYPYLLTTLLSYGLLRNFIVPGFEILYIPLVIFGYTILPEIGSVGTIRSLAFLLSLL